MDQIDEILEDYFDNRIELEELDAETVKLVLERVKEMSACKLVDESELACISEAEQRGSTYWEFESYSLH